MLPQVHPTLGRTIGMLCIDNWLNQGVLEGNQRLSSALKRLCNLFLFVTGWRNVHLLEVSTQLKLPRALHTSKPCPTFKKSNHWFVQLKVLTQVKVLVQAVDSCLMVLPVLLHNSFAWIMASAKSPS